VEISVRCTHLRVALDALEHEERRQVVAGLDDAHAHLRHAGPNIAPHMHASQTPATSSNAQRLIWGVFEVTVVS
jgi:hypothetical protein